MGVHDVVFEGCLVCELDAARGRERSWLLLRGVPERAVALSQFVWRYESVASGRFVGLANAGHVYSGDFRSLEVRRNLQMRGFVECVCAQRAKDHELTPVERMVQPDVRAIVTERFGATIAISQLVSLPAGWVVWRNSCYVSVAAADDGRIVLSSTGLSLEIYLANYIRKQVHSLGALFQSTSECEVLEGYCYLKMVKPEHKLASAGLCGKYPQLSRVFSLPETWFDWSRFVSLRVKGDSLCHIDDVDGELLVTWLAREFGTAIAIAQPEVRVGGKVGFSPGTNGLYIQALRCEEDWRLAHSSVVAVRHSGALQLPNGTVRLKVYQDGLLELPLGVLVRVHGMTFGAAHVRVCVLVRGGAILNLSRDVKEVGYDASDEVYGGFYRPLRKEGIKEWCDKQLDMRSSEARFIAKASAKAVVLRWPATVRDQVSMLGVAEFDKTAITDPLANWVGSRVARYELRNTLGNVRFKCGGMNRVILSRFEGGGPCDGALILNGCVHVDKEDSIALRGNISLSFDTSELTQPEDVSFHMEDIADEYIIDDGGPSDSEGFMSELRECIPGDYLDLAKCGDVYLSDMARLDLAKVPGYCYVSLLSDKSYYGVASSLGTYPKLERVLQFHSWQLEAGDVLKKYQLVKHGRFLHVEPTVTGDVSSNGWMNIVGIDYAMPNSLGDTIVKMEAAPDECVRRNAIIVTAMPVGADCVARLSTVVIVAITVSVTVNVMSFMWLIVVCVRKRKNGGGSWH